MRDDTLRKVVGSFGESKLGKVSALLVQSYVCCESGEPGLSSVEHSRCDDCADRCLLHEGCAVGGIGTDGRHVGGHGVVEASITFLGGGERVGLAFDQHSSWKHVGCSHSYAEDRENDEETGEELHDGDEIDTEPQA